MSVHLANSVCIHPVCKVLCFNVSDDDFVVKLKIFTHTFASLVLFITWISRRLYSSEFFTFYIFNNGWSSLFRLKSFTLHSNSCDNNSLPQKEHISWNIVASFTCVKMYSFPIDGTYSESNWSVNPCSSLFPNFGYKGEFTEKSMHAQKNSATPNNIKLKLNFSQCKKPFDSQHPICQKNFPCGDVLDYMVMKFKHAPYKHANHIIHYGIMSIISWQILSPKTME